MNSILDRRLLSEFDSIKDNDEELLWTGKPIYISYILTCYFSKFTLMEMLGCMPIFSFITCAILFFSVQEGFVFMMLMIIMSLVYLLVSVPFTFLYRLFSFSSTVYGYSNKRVWFTDFGTITYHSIYEIKEVEVTHRMDNTGTIAFNLDRKISIGLHGQDGDRYDYWIAIENPDEVLKMVR